MITYKLDSFPDSLKENALKEELLPSFYSCFAKNALRISVDITLHKPHNKNMFMDCFREP